MKLIKSTLIVFSIFFGIILLTGLLLVLIDIFQLEMDFSANGFSYFTDKFEPLKELFTVTVALFSAYFILHQIENLSISNNRATEILENEIKSKTLEISNSFYVKIQPLIRETFIYIKSRSNYLLTQDWDFNEFTDQSVNEQNKHWEKTYEGLPQQFKDKITNILNNFESISSIISNGNIDETLAFNLFGRQFTKQIEIFYPFIAGYRSINNNESKDNYSEIVKLYKNWKSLIVQ